MNRESWIRLIKYAGIAAVVPLVFFLAVFIIAVGSVQSKKELRSYENATASIVLSEEGGLIGKIYNENRTNVSFDQLPDNLIKALLATEDIRFYEHRGTDSRSLMRVLIKTILFNRKAGGGSTITQQLAKNMFGRNKRGRLSILLVKTRESILAHKLEKIFTKDEILTLYLNTVPFGENVYGIEAASERFFSKPANQLKTEESAVLIGILKANNLYNPRLNPENAKRRRNIVLSQMQKYGLLQKQQADSLTSLPLSLVYNNIEAGGPADYFLYQVKQEARRIISRINDSTGSEWNIEQDGLVIKTTLNLTLQKYANKAFRNHLSKMQKRLDAQYQSRSERLFIEDLAKSELKNSGLDSDPYHVALRQVFDWEGNRSDSMSVLDSMKNSLLLLHAGMIVIDPVTGAVRVWSGGINFKTQPYDQVLARRQMGSTFKPLLYAAALEQGIRPCTYLDNDSIILPGFENWSPQNYDHTYGGKYSLTGALVNSMNVPTFNLFLRVGYETTDSLWRRMEFSYRLDNTPSLPLGTAEASIYEMAAAYAAFANGGMLPRLYKISSIETANGKILWKHPFSKAKRVISSATSRLISAMLEKAVQQGTGSAIHSVYEIKFPLAGKTGTSQDYTDAWFAAFNPSLVIISRAGASLPSVHFTSEANGTGSALALPLVGLTLNKIQTDAKLSHEFISWFSPPGEDLQYMLDCPDFRDDNVFDELKDLFRGRKLDYDTTQVKPRKRKPFFRSIFGKQN